MLSSIKPVIGPQTYLHRRGEKRADRQWLAQRRAEATARFLILADLKAPIIPDPVSRTARLRWESSGSALELPSEGDVYLGDDPDGSAVFAANIPAHRLPAAAPHLESRKPYVDLRSLAIQGVLPDHELLIAAQARAILGWHATQRCCIRCGTLTKNSDGGWRRTCPACGLDAYPRTDPAVIMLITNGGRCLLGHEHRFPDKLYSTLAGFVEAGDDIENAVRREVREEAGLEVGPVHYVASQPWPFPHSLMIGCWGEALTDTIVIEPSELVDARWFTKAEVEAMMALRHPEGLLVPPAISMAHVLLRGFLDGSLG